MKTYIGTLALLVTVGFTAEARADRELHLTLEPVTSEAQLHQAMVQNRARVAAQYRHMWEQAEAAEQARQQVKDGDQTQTQNQTRTQARKRLKSGDQSGDQLQTRTRTQAKKQLKSGDQTQTRTQIRSMLRAQRDADTLSAELRYQTRERVRTGKSEAQGGQGTGGKRLGGHGGHTR